MIFLASSLGLDINEEGVGLAGDDDGIEQEGAGRVVPLRGTICGVFHAQDVFCVNCFTTKFQ